MKSNAASVELSPSGRSLSVLIRNYASVCRADNLKRVALSNCDSDERRLAPTDVVRVFDTQTMQQTRAFALPDDTSLNWMEWTSPDNLLVSITTAPRYERGRARTGTRFGPDVFVPPATRILSIAMGRDEPVLLFGTDMRLVRGNRYLGGTVDLLHDDPDHVLMGAYLSDDYDLFRVDVNDGSAERIAKGTWKTIRWQTDREGRPALRMDCTNASCRSVGIYTPEAGSDPNDEDTRWRRVRTFERIKRGDAAERLGIELIAPAEAANQYYAAVEGDALERRAIKIYDVATDSFVRDVFSDPNYDVGGGLVDPETGQYAGAWLWRDRIEYRLEDKRIAKHLKAINGYFGNEWNVSMLGFSGNGMLAVVYASAPNNAGGYYLYDFEKRHVGLIFDRVDALPADLGSKTEILSVPTRDGQALTAYRTVPTQLAAAGESAPLIVLVHGGPEMRDTFSYDRDVQFLASRGYQVLQVNFRGSSGYGAGFASAGYGEWGGRMQDDVIDATRHLVTSGKADPERICIMGHSYGGYAALFAGAATPELFRCVVAGAGVSDLNASLKQDRREYGADSAVYAYWKVSMVDAREDEAALAAVSPVNMAERFEDPVLLIHGTDDEIVRYSHSEEMRDALRDAGKAVTMLSLGEGHHHDDWSIESSTLYFETLETFLADVFSKQGG
ncbi:MAG: alpha/beta fold hydrolase [Litorimonas sp.]